jgi:hypothetical protein
VEEQRTVRTVTVAVMVVAALVGALLVSGGTAEPGTAPAVDGGAAVALDDPGGAPTTTAPAAPSAPATTAVVAPRTTAPATTAPPDPGALPQTDERPVASGAQFDAGVQGLWEAIRQDRPELGMPFFFPKSAYLQVKAISDPAADYQQRLIANYEDDIHALHGQLGPDASSAQFVGIDVPDSQAVLVQPGEESNRLSYWRVYGSTLQYQVDGQAGSFPVTSLISWRGQWYVVHLGEIR